MRIALLPDEYLPDGTRVHSKMFHDLALYFTEIGHHPVVITPGPPSQASRLVVDYVEGIEVWRFRAGYTRGVGMIRRAINEWFLPLRAWLAIRQRFKAEKFDLCINYAPTIFFGPLARRFQNKGVYVYLILRDMFPQWIIDQGLIGQGSIPARFFRYYERLNYRSANFIGVQSEANLNVFKSKFPEFKDLEILRNWAAIKPVSESSPEISIIPRPQLNGKVVFFYGGNIGHAQDMESIMRLARKLRHVEEIHFLIVGQGDQYDFISQLRLDWGLSNVTIEPSVTQKEFPYLLSKIDVGLFSLAYRHTAHNFPGKLLGYMVESKPILGIVNPGNDLLEMMESKGAGLVFVNGDDESFIEAAIKLARDSVLRRKIGSNARRLLLNEFSVDSIGRQILSKVEDKPCSN